MSSSPLDCALCGKELQDPVYLDCSHLFCKKCVTGKSECPTCARSISPDFGFDIDPLTSFLIDTSHEAAETCANCDKISQPMFFCETCQQSLCVTCKTETHEARMFARHRLVPLEERARVRGRVTCPAHSQPYVLYCGETKNLVCIDCFKGRTIENGHSFVAIDQAHRVQLEKLEQLAERLHAFQEEHREEAAARDRLIGEINENYRTTKNDIYSVCQQVVDTVLSVREKLTRELEEDRRKKEEECRAVVKECQRAMSSGSFCLLASHILCSAASFIDFLQLNGELTRRIQSHLSLPSARPPTPSSCTIPTRAELARSLDTILGLGMTIGGDKAGGGSSWRRRGEGSGCGGGYKGRRSGSPVSVLSKYQMMVDLAGAFGSLIVQIDSPLKEATREVAHLTRAVQERQRDMTMRKLLLRREEIEDTVESLSSVRDRIRMIIDRQKELRPDLQQIWEEELERVTRQQMMYRNKMEEATSLEEQADRALTVSRNLLPYAEGIERMTEILDRKRLHPPDPAPMESICIQINTLSPDSKQRVQAIEKEEQLRLAAWEAKRREEDENVKAKTVASLKHTKKREARRGRIVDDRRERSPGGTDVALLSPFHRHTISITSEESEAESTTVDLEFDGTRSRRTTVDEYYEEDESTVDVMENEEDKQTNTVTITEERRSASLKVNKQSGETAHRRHTVLSSLNRAIEDYGGGEGNLKASEVRRAERRRANTGDPLLDVPYTDRPVSAPVLVTVPDDGTTVSEEETKSTVAESAPSLSFFVPTVTSPPPAVPFVPQEVFNCEHHSGAKLGAFEVRERMLESLKGRVAKYDSEESDEQDTVRL